MRLFMPLTLMKDALGEVDANKKIVMDIPFRVMNT